MSFDNKKKKIVTLNLYPRRIVGLGTQVTIPARKWRKLKHRMVFFGVILIAVVLADILFHVTQGFRVKEMLVAALVDVFLEKLLTL